MSALSEPNCFYHPERPAMGNCTECQHPICLACQMQIAGKTVCRECVSAIRARVAGEISGDGAVAAQAEPIHQPAPTYSQAPNPAETGVYQPYSPLAVAPAQSMGIKHVFGGFALGFLSGIVGLVAWFAFVYFSNWNFALFAVGVGWLIGTATVKGAGGRGGNVVAVMSAILAFIFCGIGVLPSFLEGDAWGWIFGLLCLFFGVQQAYKTPMAAEQSWH